MTIFRLPDLGEGLPDAEISEWHVKVGDHIILDQSLVSMETAKAVVEVPSPFTGIIKKLYGKVGDIIKTGEPLVELENEVVSTAKAAEGTKNAAATERSENAATVAGRLEVGSAVLKESPVGIPMNIRTASGVAVKVTPAVRALAQRLQVNLGSVIPTGPNNTITSQDVEQAVKLQSNNSSTHAVAQNETRSAALAEGFEPVKGTRRTMANIMTLSHAEVVPVTVVDDALLFRWHEKQEKQDITVRLIQAMLEAIKLEPALNVLFDGKTVSRKFLKEVHLGLAVDTADGLFVPVIHNANTLDANQLRQTVDRIKKQVSDRSIKAEELKGATITLSNFGKFAGRYASPIVIPPTVAILGVGSLREQMIVQAGETKPSVVLPLSLTVDHRAVTGGEATRFLGAVIKSLER